MGWVLIPYDSMLPGGTPCEQKPETEKEHPSSTHEPMPIPHEPVHHQLTKHLPHHPEEDLEKVLKDVRAKLYLRKNPHNGQEEKEWGKEWQGKVYFRELGKWVNHPVLPEAGNEPAQPGKGEPTGGTSGHKGEVGHEEPKGTAGSEQSRQGTDTQAAISKAPRALHSKGGQSRWTKLLKEDGVDKWFVQESGQWVLWDEQPSGQKSSTQSQQSNTQEREKPGTGDVIPSMTIRNTQKGPGTYNPILPGAPGSGITSPNTALPAGESPAG